jgi:hypothetical protein
MRQVFSQGIEAGQVGLVDALVLDENLKCLAHAFGVNQRLEKQAGAGLLAFAHPGGLQVGEIAVSREA